MGSGRRMRGGRRLLPFPENAQFYSSPTKSHRRHLFTPAEMNGSDAKVWAQSNVEDPPNYKGDPTPSEGATGTEISSEKKKEISRMVSHDAKAEGVERGEFG